MKKSKFFAKFSLFIICLLTGNLLSVSAASDPTIHMTATNVIDGEATVILSLQDIPTSNNVEYAQIELVCESENFMIVPDSLHMDNSSKQIKSTANQNSEGNGVLLLVEPETNTFEGLRNGDICSFVIKNETGKQTDLTVSLHAILILKDGMEYEWSTDLSTPLVYSSENNGTMPSTPDTGENSHISFGIILLFISGCSLAGIVVLSKRRT